MHARFEHPTEDTLEAYSLGTLSERDVELLEEHLLICADCQNQLTKTDEFVRHIRVAAAKLRTEIDDRKAGSRRRLLGLAAWPAPVWAAAAVCCMIALIWVISSKKVQQQPIAVMLQAVRGTQDGSKPEAPTPNGIPLRIDADLTGLNTQGLLRLELVDAAGAPVQRADVTPQGGQASMLLKSGLEQGTYWVRLYRAAPEGELLREYALRVE